jgi:hypothetical protein
MSAETTREALTKALREHAWQDDTAQVGYEAVLCSCGWRASTPRSIYALRVLHDDHRAEAIAASGAVIDAATLADDEEV